jgi:hypothetical protein
MKKMMTNRKVKFFRSVTLHAEVNKEYDNLLDLVLYRLSPNKIYLSVLPLRPLL